MQFHFPRVHKDSGKNSKDIVKNDSNINVVSSNVIDKFRLMATTHSFNPTKYPRSLTHSPR